MIFGARLDLGHGSAILWRWRLPCRGPHRPPSRARLRTALSAMLPKENTMRNFGRNFVMLVVLAIGTWLSATSAYACPDQKGDGRHATELAPKGGDL